MCASTHQCDARRELHRQVGDNGRDHGRSAGVPALYAAPVEIALLADAADTIATERA
jgi:hypothetical protein